MQRETKCYSNERQEATNGQNGSTKRPNFQQNRMWNSLPTRSMDFLVRAADPHGLGGPCYESEQFVLGAAVFERIWPWQLRGNLNSHESSYADCCTNSLGEPRVDRRMQRQAKIRVRLHPNPLYPVAAKQSVSYGNVAVAREKHRPKDHRTKVSPSTDSPHVISLLESGLRRSQ
jgi:hypothetical protein